MEKKTQVSYRISRGILTLIGIGLAGLLLASFVVFRGKSQTRSPRRNRVCREKARHWNRR